ncbi:MAG: class I SAM-dependent methyltransferase, partial [Candidatus Eremiobacteraeota bacterium]|nr:class I SAM-dependent methyltransferase [Candidatus Eremiobacteraeota bacterium]
MEGRPVSPDRAHSQRAARQSGGDDRQVSVEEHLERVYKASAPDELSLAYDAWSNDYDRDLGQLGWHAPREAARLVAERVQTEAPVLDVGAGTGLVGAELAGLGLANLTALDLSEQMLQRALARGVYSRAVKACLGQTLPLEARSFEAS